LVWRKSRPVAGALTKMIRIETDGYSSDARRLPIDRNDLPAALGVLRGESGDVAVAEVLQSTIVAHDYNLSPARYLGVKSLEEEDGPELAEAVRLLQSSVSRISSRIARIEEISSNGL